MHKKVVLIPKQSDNMIGASYAAEKSMGRMFPEKQLLDIVKSHAKWGAIVIAMPFVPVADTILYAIVLWHMYHKLSEVSHRSLKIGLGGSCQHNSSNRNWHRR